MNIFTCEHKNQSNMDIYIMHVKMEITYVGKGTSESKKSQKNFHIYIYIYI